MAYTPPVGAGSPYANYNGNPLRANMPALMPVIMPAARQEGVRAREVVAVVHHTPSGDLIEYNQTALPIIQRANALHPHGAGTYRFEKR